MLLPLRSLLFVPFLVCDELFDDVQFVLSVVHLCLLGAQLHFLFVIDVVDALFVAFAEVLVDLVRVIL